MTNHSNEEPFAHALSQLQPVAVSLDAADLMYRAGFAAGRATSQPARGSDGLAWLRVAAMVAVTGFTGYQVGMRSSPRSIVESPVVASSPEPTPANPISSIAVSEPSQSVGSDVNAESTATASPNRDSHPVPRYDWTRWFLHSRDPAFRSTAFPLIGNELISEELLDRLSLASLDRLSLASMSVTESHPPSSSNREPRRLMTAGDTAAWMNSY